MGNLKTAGAAWLAGALLLGVLVSCVPLRPLEEVRRAADSGSFVELAGRRVHVEQAGLVHDLCRESWGRSGRLWGKGGSLA